MEIVRAESAAAGALTKIAFAAKGHWGYPEEWIHRWAGELTVTAEYISAHPTYAAVLEGEIVGFHALQLGSSEAVLDHLWVRPNAMRKGVGRALFEHAENLARERGAGSITIVGDPNAEGFYKRMGAVVYGRQPATMDGQPRFLPLLRKPL